MKPNYAHTENAAMGCASDKKQVFNPTNGTRKSQINAFKRKGIFALALLIGVLATNQSSGQAAGEYRSRITGNWNTAATWEAATWSIWHYVWQTATSAPTNANTVYILTGHTITVTANAAASSLIFEEGTTSTLTVNSGTTLAVTNAITVRNDNTSSTATTISGSGTLTSGSLIVGGTTTALSGDATTTLTSSISSFTISGGIMINGEDDASDQNNATFNINSGIVSAASITVDAENDNGGTSSSISTISLKNAPQSGTLNVSGAVSATGTGTKNLNFDGTTATVNYTGAAQTVYPTTYTNLTFSGSGLKTNTSTTVNGTLSMQGTATASAAPTYGSAATLEYKGSAAQTTGPEFPSSLDAKLTINNSNGVTLNAAKTITKDVTLTLGAFSAGASNYNLSVGGNWTNNGGTFTPGTNTVTFNGTGAQAINGTAASQTFNDIIINKTAGQTLSVSGNTATLTANNLTETQGNFTAPATLNINAALTLTTGTFTAGANTNIKGNWTYNGGTFTHSSGTVVFNGSAAQTISGTSATAFNNLTVSNNAAPVSVSTNINVASTLNMNGSATKLNPVAGVVINSAASSGTITGSGTIQVTRTTTNPDFVNQYKFNTNNLSSMTVDYAGAGNQTVNSTVGNYGAVMVSGSGTKTAAGGITVNSDLIVNAGTFDANSAFTHSISGKLSNNGTINGSSSTINLKGNWTNNGTFTANTSTINFNGTSLQTIDGTALNNTFNNLTVDNTSGVALSKDQAIDGILRFTNGKLSLAGNTLTLTANGTYADTSSSKYVVTDNIGSRLYKKGINNASFKFPVGTTDKFLPVTITSTDNSEFSVKVFTTATKDAVENGTQFTDKTNMVDAIWLIDRPVGTQNPVVKLHWGSAIQGSRFQTLPNSMVGISRYNGITWDGATASGAGADMLAHTVTSAFNNFGSGTKAAFGISQIFVPLPIVLKFFTGSPVKNTAQLNWETDNDEALEFTLEKSTDGRTFNAINTVNSNASRKYAYADPIQSGINYYYRLKMKELNGTFTYSSTVNIKTDKSADPVASVYPNPAKDWLEVNHSLFTTPARAEVTDLQGRLVISQDIENNTGHTRVNISNLPQGYFMIRIKGEALDFSQPFIHQ